MEVLKKLKDIKAKKNKKQERRKPRIVYKTQLKVVKEQPVVNMTIQLPSLVGTQEFTPSGLMIKTLCAYLQALQDDSVKSPIQILSSLGSSKQNWYNWQVKDGFAQWWTRACAEYHENIGLSHVHAAIYRRAVGNSPQDAKLHLERFDKQYKPTTGTEVKFPGIAPPEDLQGALERSKARQIESTVVDNA